MQKLESNYALITGASSGIGEALAQVMAQDKRNLVLVARRVERLNQLAQKLNAQYGVKVEVFAQDLMEENASTAILKYIEEKILVVDILVNNAGMGKFSPITESTWMEQKKIIDLNISSLTELAQTISKYWKEKKIAGKMLNVASMGAYFPIGNFSVYTATKAYVKSFSLATREELKPYGISVSCLCPGGTRTEFMDKAGQEVMQMGEMSMMTAEDCARIAYRGLVKNKAIIIPGLFNFLSSLTVRVLNESLNVSLSTKLFSMAVKERK